MGTWRVEDKVASICAAEAVDLLRRRLSDGPSETWFESDTGELLAVVTNGERAMVMLLREPGDAGEHAIDVAAGATSSGGFVLANGQVDSFPDRDTVRFDEALALVTSVIDGGPRVPQRWAVDR